MPELRHLMVGRQIGSCDSRSESRGSSFAPEGNNAFRMLAAIFDATGNKCKH